jgi:putative ABC transport system permease protein
VTVETLKPGKFQSFSKAYIPVFNITQLAISIILIVGSAVIMKQINYITNKDIGINKDVIEINIPPQYNNISNIFKAELEKNTSVEMISLANASPVLEHFMLLLEYEENGIKKQYTPSVFVGDENYTKTLGVNIIGGEDFSDNAESNTGKCIINQSLAKLFPGQDLIGKTLPGDNNMTVIGISNDFHYSSLDRYIEPGYIAYNNSGHYLLVRSVSGKTAQVREVISSVWAKLITDYPLNIETVGERYKWMHRENANYAKLIGSCCFISIFLSMMGLFDVSLYTCQRRVKEIGIRKVNGARIAEVMVLLNKNFIKWNLIAFILACPIAWYTMHKWLQNFAYKTELSWWLFAAAGAVAVALLTVSWQSWRAATRNPVEALRYE